MESKEEHLKRTADKIKSNAAEDLKRIRSDAEANEKARRMKKQREDSAKPIRERAAKGP